LIRRLEIKRRVLKRGSISERHMVRMIAKTNSNTISLAT
jgi:hypothetical protein